MAKITDVLYEFKNLGPDTSVSTSQYTGVGEKKKVKNGETVIVDYTIRLTLNDSKNWDLVGVSLPKEEVEETPKAEKKAKK